MPEPLTDLERQILDFMVEYLRQYTYQPSIREIGRHFSNKSTKTVSEHLQALADKGWIERDPSRSRGVRLLTLDLRGESVTVPVFALEAGSVPPSAADAIERLELDRKLAGGPGAFLVSFPDDDRSAALRRGDLLIVEPVPEEALESGDLVLVRMDGQTCLRRYFLYAADLVREPAGEDATPRLVRGDRPAAVLGRVIGLVRRLRAPAWKPSTVLAHARHAADKPDPALAGGAATVGGADADAS